MRVIREINRGGFGIVNEVEFNGKRFAKKVFDPLPNLFDSQEAIEKARRRFVREVRIQSLISHPNFMPIVSIGLNDNPPWFLMPVADEDYSAQIDRDRASRKVSLDPLLDILAALEELHRLGYVHRDFKPQNVLLLDGKWTLSDFGLVLPTTRTTTVLTGSDSAYGTQAYAAPELINNFRYAPPQTDIFAFGCLLHDIVGTSSRVPFARVTAPGPLGPIIERCTEVDPSDRFVDIAALRSALVVTLAKPILVQGTPRADELVTQLVEDTDSIDLVTWEEIVRKIENDPDADDAEVLFRVIDIPQLEALEQSEPKLFSRLAPLLCRWIRRGNFAFEYCDVLGARLTRIYELGSIREKAEATLAALELGYRHNRWFVMRKFATMANESISLDLADRLAIDIAAMGQQALSYIEVIEEQIRHGRRDLHPFIQQALDELENQYSQ